MSIFDDFSRAIGTDKSSGALAQATGNVLAPGGTFAPGAGGLNPLNPDSIVGRMTKDIGSLNPWNPDSTAGKVVNNIGQDMQRDPLKWVAIAAAVATGQTYLIPYINGAAAVTSKNSSPEEWLTEGAKAYLISAGGEYVSNNVTGVGPQTDITTGETFAGTGASGAMNSAKAGAVAGNISRNIFATAARKGNTDINSAQIITGAITSEALNEAFKAMPGFDGLSKAEQSATVNAFKVAFNKDSNAAYQLFNQGFDATVKGLDKAAKSLGYKDLNQQNAVNNFVQDQGSTEDIGALKQYEQKVQDAYGAYTPLKEKNDAWFAKNDAYGALWNKYNAVRLDPSYPYGEKMGMYNSLNNQWGWLQDPSNYHTPDVVAAAEQTYKAAQADAEPFIKSVSTLQEQGWDNLAQQKEAAAAGFTTPETYDTYLTDKKAKEDAEASQAEIDRITKETSDAEAAARQAAIDEQNKLDAAEAERRANDEAERLRLAGLEEKKEVDLNKVVTGGDTTDEDAEQAKRVAEFGKDLTGGGKQDLGEVDVNTPIYSEDSTGMGAYKYDPTSGTYTYTSDDGSTLTLDGDGNIVGSTESTDTSWTGLTDTATGNLKLPKLPGGKMPVVKPPTQRVATTKPITTPAGTGNTAVPTGGNAAAQPGGGLNIPALLAIMSGLNQPQQQVQQTQEPAQDFQYFDWSADPFAPKTKDKTNPTTQPKMAGGGSVDELLEILRRSGI
jgi:hypothetical protein